MSTGFMYADCSATSHADAGYLSGSYAASFQELGSPRLLPSSFGWTLQRQIPGTLHWDVMGCYPLFVCRSWNGLAQDLHDLSQSFVSLTLVADPLGDYDTDQLKLLFTSVCRPFKEHFAVDFSKPLRELSSGHRRNLRLASRSVDVELVGNPAAFEGDWIALYQQLIARHQIGGIPAFSSSTLAAQLRVPGLIVFRATHKGETVGMTLWYESGLTAYYHLGAYSGRGYSMRASFALFHEALSYFRARVRWVLLGAGAGLSVANADGLSRFKSGWANASRSAWLCGRIFDEKLYGELAQSLTSSSRYFPAYRTGEFG